MRYVYILFLIPLVLYGEVFHVEWEDIKGWIDSKELKHQYIANDKFYTVIAEDENIILSTRIYRNENSNALEDFEANYKDDANLPLSTPFADPGGYSVATIGVGPEDLNTNNNNEALTLIDIKMLQTMYINGAEVLTENPCFGDKLDFDIVDVDGILGYGENFIIYQFGTDVGVRPDGINKYIFPYNAKLSPGLYVRVIYHRFCAATSRVYLNMIMHRKT